MRYEKPDFVEIKMDAEIGSYQSDPDPQPAYTDRREAQPVERAIQADA
jgi:hypothetical protein